MTKITRLLPVLVLFLLFSCSLQKRNYRYGYHLEWLHSKQEAVATKQLCEKTVKVPLPKIEIAPITVKTAKEPALYASISKGVPLQVLEFRNPADSCDLIVFHDKKEKSLSCKIIEITDIEVRYRNCNEPDGGTLVLTKTKVSHIQYANGQTEYFSGKRTTTDPAEYEARVKKATGNSIFWSISGALLLPLMAVPYLVSALFSLMWLTPFLAILALVLGRYAFKQGRLAMELIGADVSLKEKYEKKARTGKALGLTTAILVVLGAVFFLFYLLSFV